MKAPQKGAGDPWTLSIDVPMKALESHRVVILHAGENAGASAGFICRLN